MFFVLLITKNPALLEKKKKIFFNVDCHCVVGHNIDWKGYAGFSSALHQLTRCNNESCTERAMHALLYKEKWLVNNIPADLI